MKKRQKPSSKRVRSQATQTGTSTGPVTLEEARALASTASVQAHAPRRSLIAEVTPGSIAAERKKLALQQQREIALRLREYKATFTIMKQRGVKGLPTGGELIGKHESGSVPGPQGRQMRALKEKAGLPLQVFAEGDSWFDYPVLLFGGGIIPRLEKKLGVPILNLAVRGAEVRNMLGVKERKILIKVLKDGCPAGGTWDALLFSGGGNDIVDDPMALWIAEYDASLPLVNHIHKARFGHALALVRAGYEDLIGLRNRYSPTTQLLFHAYDYAIPDGRGICGYGPWLKPTFDLRNFPSQASAFAVVKEMLQRFSGMLAALEKTHRGVTFLNKQGTLQETVTSWHNELHPSKSGFNRFAEEFHSAIKLLFPGRVL